MTFEDLILAMKARDAKLKEEKKEKKACDQMLKGNLTREYC